MAEPFYPFVGSDEDADEQGLAPAQAARVAVYDDPLSTPRVVEIAPTDVRSYLEQITETTNRLAHEQGSSIPFMVIREVVENLIHAYFEQPTISILDNGDTICFSDRGPGIPHKDLARQYGTSSATEQMRKYIRGVGSGLPYVEAWLDEHGGTLEIADNISGGTMVTVSLVRPSRMAEPSEQPAAQTPEMWGYQNTAMQPAVPPQQAAQPAQPVIQGYPPQMQPMPAQAPYPGYAAYPQQAWPQQGWPQMPAVPGYGVPQQTAWPPQMPPAQPASAAQPSNGAAHMVLDQREEQVLSWLSSHELVGPKDLMEAYGQSAPTWSRVLNGLESRGLVRKSGQKRTLTDAGRAYVAQR